MGPEALDSDSGSPTFVKRQERFQGTGKKMNVMSGEQNGKISSLGSLVTGLRELGRSRFSGRSRNYRGLSRGRRFFKYPLGEELPSLE